MKLSISNIAWDRDLDERIYEEMIGQGYRGLEIAPTRIFPEAPYDHLMEARRWADSLLKRYKLSISSMQSIWYGREERIFGTREEREELLRYTKKAIDFAEMIGCGNLVLGSPKNRNREFGGETGTAISFFREIGEYASDHGAVVALEANPAMYHTNYLNTTMEAIETARAVNSEGIKVNLDLGTVICNGEDLHCLRKKFCWIHHIHLSEPGLRAVQCREIHRELKEILDESYGGYLSIEMGKGLDAEQIFEVMRKVREVFYEV